MDNRHYTAGMRLATIVHELHLRRLPWLMSDIAERYEVHPRTVQRYVSALKDAGIAERCGIDGEPAIMLRRY